MSETLVVLPQDMSLCAAAHLLSDSRISGAPVVDEEGRCVGVFSAMDFLRWAQKGGFRPPHDDICQPWEIIESEAAPRDVVREHMTPNPVVVEPHTPIRDLARRMIDVHIHRVIVVDECNRPKGIIASTDILAAIAYAEPAGMCPVI